MVSSLSLSTAWLQTIFLCVCDVCDNMCIVHIWYCMALYGIEYNIIFHIIEYLSSFVLYINQWCYNHLRSCFLRRQLKFTVRNLYNEKPKPIKFLQVVSTSWFPQSCQSFTSPLQKLIKFPVGIQSKPQDRCVSFCLDSSSQDSIQGAFATNICLPVCFFFSALFHIFFFFDFYISY